jgi:hypothetical protein
MADLLMKVPIPYEPKKANRFILRFDSTLGINEWFIQTSDRPSIDIKSGSTDIPFLNTSVHSLRVDLNWDPN